MSLGSSLEGGAYSARTRGLEFGGRLVSGARGCSSVGTCRAFARSPPSAVSGCTTASPQACPVGLLCFFLHQRFRRLWAVHVWWGWDVQKGSLALFFCGALHGSPSPCCELCTTFGPYCMNPMGWLSPPVCKVLRQLGPCRKAAGNGIGCSVLCPQTALPSCPILAGAHFQLLLPN